MPTAPPNLNLRACLVGNNIRLARESKGLTQLTLAHAIGWTEGAQISRFERGNIEPRFSTLQRIAEALGVSLESLLEQSATKKGSK